MDAWPSDPDPDPGPGQAAGGWSLPHPGCDDHDRIERIGAWEKIIAWAQAQQYHEIGRFVDAAADAAADARAWRGGSASRTRSPQPRPRSP